MNFRSLLESIGLSASESAIYLAGLRLGPATAIQLAQKSDLTRQMVYTVIPSLIEKGLMKEVRISNKRYFQASNPEVLTDRAELLKNEIKKAVPLLKSKQATNNTLPLLSVYENPISMREWYRRFMEEATAEDELLIWATNTTWLNVDPDFLAGFIAFKNTHQIHDRIIAPDTPASRETAKIIHQPYAEYRFARDTWDTPAEKWIWRDTISFLTINENATNLIVIESPQLAAIERFSFERLWKWLRPETNPQD
jgi:sugar-specific transcriptional regulator TrmB